MAEYKEIQIGQTWRGYYYEKYTIQFFTRPQNFSLVQHRKHLQIAVSVTLKQRIVPFIQ